MNNDEVHFRSVISSPNTSCEIQFETPPMKYQKAIRSAGLPQAAIQNGENDGSASVKEVVLIAGPWNNSSEIPEIVAELHIMDTKDTQSLQTSSLTDLSGFYSGSQAENNESDNATGNLAWLLNYKIQELPPVPGTSFETLPDDSVAQPPIIRSFSSIQPPKIPRVVSAQSRVMDSSRIHEKPPFTYTELIETALNESGDLTVSGIYQWISDHFPYYKPTDDRWKNSVRHNLSINPHFRKGSKAIQGAGHLWTICQRDERKRKHINDKLHSFLKGECNEKSLEQEKRDREEVLVATTSLLQLEHYENFESRLEKATGENEKKKMDNTENLLIEQAAIILEETVPKIDQKFENAIIVGQKLSLQSIENQLKEEAAIILGETVPKIDPKFERATIEEQRLIMKITENRLIEQSAIILEEIVPKIDPKFENAIIVGQKLSLQSIENQLKEEAAIILGETVPKIDPKDNNNQQDKEPDTSNLSQNSQNPNGLQDFLSPPVPKEQIAEECGLDNEFLLTELDPSDLEITFQETVVHEVLYDENMDYEIFHLEK